METGNPNFSNLAAKSQPAPRAGRLARFWRAAWSTAARAGVSLLVLGLWLHFSSIDLRQVFQALGTLPGFTIVGALAAGVCATFVAAVKYLLLLRAQQVPIGLLRVWQFNFIAGFYGLVLPGTESGNAVKALLLGRVSRRSTGVWAAMFADQISLLQAFALIAFAGVTFVASDAQLAGRGAWIAGAGLALAGTFVLDALFLFPPFAALIQRLLQPLSRLLRWPRKSADASDTSAQEEGWLARFWKGMASYQHHLPTLAICLLLSACYEALLVLGMYQLALGLGIQVSYLNLLWIITLVSTSQALPITFAGIGVRDVALTFLLGGLGVPGAAAIALSFAVLAFNVALGLPGAVLQIFLPRALPGAGDGTSQLQESISEP
ncbi:MAG TPA: lysylphosphatidylglycerol synthase transmembrane domain-containing protein [Ktedonobacterales bacterium]|nr:lysylphosphatidylglycerol synthase transmembrane domain-containing protein [Ktedonobacterales bacterium]